MKQRIATPVSGKKITKATVTFLATLMILAAPLSVMPKAHADKYDDQIAAVQREIDAYQREASKYKDQADTLQNKVRVLQNEQNQIQAEIDLQQAKYNKLKSEIKKTEKAIADNKIGLGEVIANMYVDDEISPLEMLASSKNIGDYVDKQEYRSSIRDQLTDTIKTIKTLKIKLEKQKEAVQTVLDNQKRARDTLVAKKTEQQKLLNATRGKENTYRDLTEKSKQEKLRLQEAQQAAIRAAIGAHGGVTFIGGTSGGYPWNTSNCYVDGNAMSYGGADGNGGDGWGYGCRQCVSYAAWKIGQYTGIIPTYMGNANNVPGHYPASRKGTTARAHSAGVISAGYYGHIVWVETDPDASGNIIVSQYNYNYGSGWGMFSRMKVHQSTYDTYIYF